ncbi:TPA: hypothetical protein ACH3X3_008193 [Trebouxia sp. C0006]
MGSDCQVHRWSYFDHQVANPDLMLGGDVAALNGVIGVSRCPAAFTAIFGVASVREQGWSS